MKDVEIIGMLKAYIKASLAGVGALKGAPCQCIITENADGTHKVTMKWVDNDGNPHTDSFNVLNGQVGKLADIADISLTNLADGDVVAYNSTTKKWENVANSATVNTLNSVGDVTITTVQDGQVLVWSDLLAKWVNKNITASEISAAGGGTVQSELNQKADSADLTALATSVQSELNQKADSADLAAVATSGDYDDLRNKPTLGTAATKDTTNTVTQDSTSVLTSGGAYTALDGKADKSTTLSGYGITDVYTKTQTDSAISTEIGKLDVSDSVVNGSYIKGVSETNGKISVTREAADTAPTASSKKMATSGGIFTAIENAAGNVSEAQYSAIATLLS